MPTCPVAVKELLITGVVVATVTTKVAVPVPALLMAPIETLEVPADVGVPVIAPVAVFTERPAGRPVALKLVGELLAVIW